MKFFAFIKTLPQPVRSLYYAFFVVLVVGVVTSAVGAGSWFVVPLGVVALLLGLCLVSNFKDSAAGVAQSTASYRPWGVDYSKSIMASPTYARFFGGCLSLVGLMFILLAL